MGNFKHFTFSSDATIFPSNSEACGSELLDYIERMFSVVLHARVALRHIHAPLFFHNLSSYYFKNFNVCMFFDILTFLFPIKWKHTCIKLRG